ncbi:MAG: FAD-dependent oxidoreductase [Janthinobacterium lividum]
MPQFDVVVLGAGPSGLTAAYCLGKAGARVAVIERGPHCGGLMRGIKRGDCTFDLGRKELYNRFPEVHQLWTELLGDDYREYSHRVGVVYEGRILEKESSYRGRLRGMTPLQTARLATSYLGSQIKPGSREANSFQDYYSLRYGRAYYDAFVHGFNRKFEGRSPAEIPNTVGERTVPRFGFLRQTDAGGGPALDALFSGQAKWRHPARGTQQIVDRLEDESRRNDVEFLLESEILAIEIGGEGIHRLRLRQQGQESTLSAKHVISSLPLQLLAGLLKSGLPEKLRTPPPEEILFKKSTALVYLTIDGEPSFPHNWLEINDLDLKMGRVVNYATWNGDMIPKGKTGLCVEYFVFENDPVMTLSKQDLLQLAIHEVSSCGLLKPAQVKDHLVLQLPRVNASTVIHDRKQEWMREVSEHLDRLPRFFDTSRPGMDRATLAGIDAAEACVRDQPMRRRSLATSSQDV